MYTEGECGYQPDPGQDGESVRELVGWWLCGLVFPWPMLIELVYCVVQWHALDRSEQAKYYEMAREERAKHMQVCMYVHAVVHAVMMKVCCAM